MNVLQKPKLAKEQQIELAEVYRTTRDVRIRTRIQMVLLACEKYRSASSGATIICGDNEKTVRRQLKHYLKKNIEGLFDRSRAGALPKSIKARKRQNLETVQRYPRSFKQLYSMWTLQHAADYPIEHIGSIVSPETVRRLLVSREIVFSQPQHTISGPDFEYIPAKGEEYPTWTICVVWDSANTLGNEEADVVIRVAEGRITLLYPPPIAPDSISSSRFGDISVTRSPTVNCLRARKPC